MIQVENVSKNFYNIKALHEVSLKVEAGTVLGVLGPNGAGKSTLFKIIAGFLAPDAGRVRRGGDNWPKIGYKPERLLLPNQLTLDRYLRYAASLENLSGAAARSEIDQILEMVGLTAAAKARIGSFSKGMRQRAAIAQALLGNAPLLLFDEPWSGLDPEGQQLMERLMQQLRLTGRTILISTHRLHELTHVCTHLAILNRGELRYEANMASALSARPHILIQTNQDVALLTSTLSQLHPEIKISERTITLHGEAL
ncbi:MAG: ABC transporter ATP-binding protein, partial [Anaerolineales bacterium]|nr:ABC transporter ATP-binding protein [Anaerolineales bacterium]